MSDPLGLSIGTTNLVAARVGSPPIVRRAVLNLFTDRAPELGACTDDSGVELKGFVDRVGDPVPLVASDGSSYHADQLVVEALDALIEAVGGEPPAGQLAISVPAHWDTRVLRAMRAAMRTNPSLAPNGVPARLVSDAVAALTALRAAPGLPAAGIVALVDFGGGGTTITLADAASAFEPLATSRFTEFSGDQIDQALLARVLDSAAHTGDAVAALDESTGTAEISALTALRDACRAAKEQLSTEESAEIAVDLPGYDPSVPITRSELDPLLHEPLSALLAELDDLLQRNDIEWSKVSAVAAVGGGARIPLVGARLAEHVASHAASVPVVTTASAMTDAAVGATLFAVYGADADAQTGMAPAALSADIDASPGLDTGPKTETAGVPTAGIRALAWSQDEAATDDVLPYTGDDSYDTTTTRAVAQYVAPVAPVTAEPSKAVQRFPLVAFGIAAVAAAAAVGGVAVSLTSHSGPAPAPPTTTPSSTAAPIVRSVAPPPVVVAPPPAPVEAPPSTITVTAPAPVHTAPPVTHTAPPAPHTVATHAPTTTAPPVTTSEAPLPPPPPPPPPPSETPTTTTPTMTTAYIRVPFVPVPIPIQVPKGPDETTPANPYLPGYQQSPG